MVRPNARSGLSPMITKQSIPRPTDKIAIAAPAPIVRGVAKDRDARIVRLGYPPWRDRARLVANATAGASGPNSESGPLP